MKTQEEEYSTFYKTINMVGGLKTHPTKKYKIRKLSDISSIAIHHSLTKQGGAVAFANWHVTHNKWPGIGYHYVITKTGIIHKTNELWTKSYHVGNSNQKAIGICLIGDFRVEEPTCEQKESALELCTDLLTDSRMDIKEVLGHSEYPKYETKECPVISMDKFRKDLHFDQYKMITQETPPTETA